MDFSRRSYQKEILDNPDISYEDIKRNMDELETVNRLLGGHKTTVQGLKKLLGQNQTSENYLTICEIGCGGGDNLNVIGKWCEGKNIPALLIGIDNNLFCIEVARKRLQQKESPLIKYKLLTTDYIEATFKKKPDIVFSSLFCHHFTDIELLEMIHWMKSNSEIGFFINDLHRHPLAYYSIKFLTRAFSKSYLVKNDAPLSVLRSFTKKDWQILFHKAGIYALVSWHWAFRWLVIYNRR